MREIKVCNHWLHADCLESWLRIKDKCPLCNADLNVLAEMVIDSGLESMLDYSGTGAPILGGPDRKKQPVRELTETDTDQSTAQLESPTNQTHSSPVATRFGPMLHDSLSEGYLKPLEIDDQQPEDIEWEDPNKIETMDNPIDNIEEKKDDAFEKETKDVFETESEDINKTPSELLSEEIEKPNK